MTKIDKVDYVMRVALGVLLFVFAAAITAYISLSFAVNNWVTFGILALGYLAGRIARGIER